MFMSHYATEVCKCPEITSIIMEENKYISPEVKVLDVYAEGVLCGSTDQDLDMDPEYGNM